MFLLLLDIDECNTADICEEVCINLPGSYGCTCAEGRVLGDDDRSCKGMETRI